LCNSDFAENRPFSDNLWSMKAFLTKPVLWGSGRTASETMTHPRSYRRTRNATLVAEWLKARRFGKFVAAVKDSLVGKLFLGGGPAFSPPSPEAVFRRRSEIERLEMMTNRDLSAWKDPPDWVQFEAFARA
jgi:hypothetical protein